ncbi:glycosyltransferase family 2 protein [Hymenobacter cavernae]|uniref:Glycosyltransferase 2-like domain-containing protein n=1 Tax=Hymenobacter cavernae TaxID=2044852 RepID=A0ABQ1UJE0_9BACT|nr:glycosyltransferase family 2 protein [Hymenobacter cavernae]GGF20473.1 hypothetical protein GCM10011383_35150 [Hymenobacter cavernae]
MPFFSIIVPCYNRAAILPNTVAAILRQQEPDFELILVDDGSRDATAEVAEQLAATDARIRVFHKENGERGAARNYGAQRAQGQYLNFFDSDDEMYPNHLRVVRDYIRAHGEVEVVHTGYEVLDASGGLVEEVCDFRGDTNEALLENNFLACNSVFVRQDIALAQPFVEDRALASAEDWELWLRLASSYSFHKVSAKTFCLREHEGRSLNTISPDAVIARDELFGQLMRQNPDFRRRYPNQVNYFVANRYTFITLVLALTEHRRLDTLRYLWKAFRTDYTVLWRRRFLASIKHLL